MNNNEQIVIDWYGDSKNIMDRAVILSSLIANLLWNVNLQGDGVCSTNAMMDLIRESDRCVKALSSKLPRAEDENFKDHILRKGRIKELIQQLSKLTLKLKMLLPEVDSENFGNVSFMSTYRNG